MIHVLENRYKVVNIALAIVFTAFAIGINFYVTQGYCTDYCSVEIVRGLISPVLAATPILALVLVSLLFFPADLFRRWLWYCGGPLFILFVWEVAGVSTDGGSIAAPTRVGMAELLAQMYAGATILFIIGYYVWRFYKKRRTR